MSSTAPTIRPSRDADIAAIAAIYAHHVRHSAASFEEIPPDVEEIARRRAAILAHGLPYLVAEKCGQILGFCYIGRFQPRSGYRFTVEDSIYVDAAEVGRGIGRALLEPALAHCEQLGYRRIIAAIGGESNASIRLHERFGFAHAGKLPAVGFKFGRWIDVVLMQRALGSGASSLPG
jgi:L-amino acid N-acyltransferase YncA